MRPEVVVTGAAGYIGQILCKRLTEEGYYVIGFDKNGPRLATMQCFPTIGLQEFVTDVNKLVDKIYYGGISKVFHLAAKSVPIDESMTNPARYYDTNVGLLSNMLRQLTDCGWRGDIVFASSASVYDVSPLKVREESNICPPSHYGISKLMAEKVLDSVTVNGIRTVAMRFFNVSGAYGGLADSNPHILTKIFEALKEDKPFTINGVLFATPDGTCVRDYVHVLDVCNAMITAMRRLEITRDMGTYHYPYTAYNIGSGVGTSNLELLEHVHRVVGKRVIRNVGAARAGDVGYLVAEPSKFIREYDFVYKHSSIENIIKTAWEHYAV